MLFHNNCVKSKGPLISTQISRKMSTERKFSENVIVKSLCRPITFYKIFFSVAENFPEWKWALTIYGAIGSGTKDILRIPLAAGILSFTTSSMHMLSLCFKYSACIRIYHCALYNIYILQYFVISL
jgi:hypothetical protein